VAAFQTHWEDGWFADGLLCGSTVRQALATVTAIIDGTGSVGAVVGPALTGLVVQFAPTYNDMFYMLYASAVAATLLLARLTALELRAKLFPRNPSDDPSELAAPLLAAARVAS
jgi:nitrate/nitrite transporter NarK